MTTPVPREDLPGAPPVRTPDGEPMYWTMHTGSRSVRRMSHDGGRTWHTVSVTWSDERGRREMAAHEQACIQRELK